MGKKTKASDKTTLLISGSRGGIVFYQADQQRPSIEVRLDKDTVWLTQRQMSELFDKDSDTIGLHIRNIFSEGELEAEATTEESSVVQNEGGRRVKRHLKFYNLDMILSVGYRVNSKRGTQFRIWSAQVLKDPLLKGYSANERRLNELRQSLKLVGQVLERYDVSSDQATALLRVVTDYTVALDLLDDYDHQRVRVAGLKTAKAKGIDYDEALEVIKSLRQNFGSSKLFGLEKDKSLSGSLGAVMPSYAGKDVYPSI